MGGAGLDCRVAVGHGRVGHSSGSIELFYDFYGQGLRSLSILLPLFSLSNSTRSLLEDYIFFTSWSNWSLVKYSALAPAHTRLLELKQVLLLLETSLCVPGCVSKPAGLNKPTGFFSATATIVSAPSAALILVKSLRMCQPARWGKTKVKEWMSVNTNPRNQRAAAILCPVFLSARTSACHFPPTWLQTNLQILSLDQERNLNMKNFCNDLKKFYFLIQLFFFSFPLDK